jgi:EpsI family protein
MQAMKTRLIVITLVLAASCAARIAVSGSSTEPVTAVNIAALPRDIGTWRGTDYPVEKEVRDILETDSVLLREYSAPSEAKIGLAVVYYRNGEKVALHLPESCLLGHGTRLADRRPENIIFGGRTALPAIRLVTESENGRSFIIYYFQTGCFHTGSYLRFREKMLFNRLKGKPSGGALVRFSTTAGSGEAGLQDLHDFIRAASGVIDGCLP